MKFIDLYLVLQSIASRIRLEPDCDGSKLFTPAGKISQKLANDFHARVASGISKANRLSKAARCLNEALHDSKHPKPNLFECEENSEKIRPAGNDAWSRMISLLLQATFWGTREKRYCLEYFRKATSEGEYFLRSPIMRHETDDWLIQEGRIFKPTLLGFDSDELFLFLSANGIPYKPNTKQSNRIG